MLPNANDLSYFKVVCTTLNFSRAAEQLGISQPSLSAAMKRLEVALGSTLFIREKSGVRLTRPGEQLRQQVRLMLSQWDKLKNLSSLTSEAIQGSYTLGCHPALAQDLVPQILSNTLNTHPKLDIHLAHDLSRSILRSLLDGDIDMAIVVNPTLFDDLILTKLCDDHVEFWSNGGFMQSEITTIVADPNLVQSRKMLNEFEKRYPSPYRLIESSNLDVIAKLTHAGCGWGILPGSVVRAHHDFVLQRVPDTPSYHDEIYLAYRPEIRSIKAMQVLAEQIKKSYRDVVEL